MSITSFPQPSPPPLYRNQRHHINTPPLNPSRVAAIQASESFDKEGLLAAHGAALHDAHVLERRLHPIDGPLPPLPSPSVPSKNLKPILIKDLKLGKVHRGRALNGTLCADSLKVHSILNILEDETGLATKLCICNAVPFNYRMLLAQHLYPKGSKICVLEPYHAEFSDGTLGILVEKPSDIVFLGIPKPANEELKQLQLPMFTDRTLNDLKCTPMSQAKVTGAGRCLLALSGESVRDSQSANGERKLDPLILENASEGSIQELVDQFGKFASNRGVSQALSVVDAEESLAENPLLAVETKSGAQELPLPLMKQIEPHFERSQDSVDGLEIMPLFSDEIGQADERPSLEEQQTKITDVVDSQASKEARPASDLQDETEPHLERSQDSVDGLGIMPLFSDEIGQDDELPPLEEQPEITYLVKSEACKEEKHVSKLQEETNPERIFDQDKHADGMHFRTRTESPRRNSRFVVQDSGKLVGTIDNHEESILTIQPPIEPKFPPHNENERFSKLLETIVSGESQSKPGIDFIRDMKSLPHNGNKHSDKILETIIGREEPNWVKQQKRDGQYPSHSGNDHSIRLLKTISAEEFNQEMQQIIEHKSPPNNETEHADKLLGTTIGAEGESKLEIQPKTGKSLQPNEPEDSKHALSSLDRIPSSVNDEVNVSFDAMRANFHKPGMESNGRETHFLTDESSLGKLDAKSLRTFGNRLFADANWKGAENLYTRAIRKAEREHQSQDGDEVLLCYSNRSEAYLRQQEFQKAKADAEKALFRNPNHAKSLFRLGRAFLGLGKGREALSLLQAAKRWAPNDKDLNIALEQCLRIPRLKPKRRKKRAVRMS